MSYTFNPMTYSPDVCPQCGQGSGLGNAHVMVAGESREVPGIYLCDIHAQAGGGLVPEVTPVKVFIYLTGQMIPKGLLAAERYGNAASPTGAMIGAAIMGEVEASAALAEDLMRELSGGGPECEAEPVVMAVPADDRTAAAFDYHEHYEADAAEMAAAMDFRREADGTVTYRCPNPDCPEGNRHPMDFAAVLWDSMPVEFINALQAHIPG